MHADQSEQTGYNVSDRGRIQTCSTGQYEKTNVFSEHLSMSSYSGSDPKYNYEPGHEPNMSLDVI